MERSRKEYIQISKTVSLALRHRPWLFELELDSEGWTSIEQLLEALRSEREKWEDLNRSDLEKLTEISDKTRFEINGDRIRALYGHSIPGKLLKAPAEPPEFLYHGTTRLAAEIIIGGEGLKPMGRQYIHLSTDIETASQVGLRKGGKTVILQIAARRAFDNGVAFYKGNEHVWLADAIHPEFISIL